jgi:hypothetical protein
MRLYRVGHLVGVTRGLLREGAEGAEIEFLDCAETLESAEELLRAVLEALDLVNVFKPEHHVSTL